jgi:hypothetical protein
MMQRNLRVLGAVALAGVVAFVGAQVRARGQGGELYSARGQSGEQYSASGGGQAIASPTHGDNQRRPAPYWAAEALCRLIISDTNVYVKTSSSQKSSRSSAMPCLPR